MKNLAYILILVVAVAVVTSSCNKDQSIAKNKTQTSAQLEKTAVLTSAKAEKSVADTVVNVDSLATENFTLSFDEGLEKAAKEKKNMIVDFYTDWCHWCKVMDEKTFHNPDVAKKLRERFITVRLDAENPQGTATFQGHTFNNVELTRAFRVSGFPSLGFISPDQEVITVMPGYKAAGEFIYILDYIDKKCWEKKISLEEFIRKQGECDSTEAATPDAKTL